MYLVFVYSYVASKIKKKEKMKEKVMLKLKRSFSSHWLMVRLNWSSDNIRNCKETTTFIKECKKNIECKKKGIFNLAYKQGLIFEKSTEPDKSKEMYKKYGASKTHKSVSKVSKTQSGNEFKWCRNMLELF